MAAKGANATYVARYNCNKTGIQEKSVRKQLASFKDLENILIEAIKDAEKATNNADLGGYLLVGATVVKIASDWTYKILAKGLTPGGEIAANYAFDIMKMMTEAAAKADSGDTLKTSLKMSTQIKLDGFEKATGKKAYGKINDLWDFVDDAQELYQAVNQAAGASDGISSARASAAKTLKMIKEKIAELEAALAECSK